ncbi:transglycosylase SLT domain-containing protein [Bdellovibrio sp. NC01]|uniref:transglycosylase SLT domain-containing protein n=1 Tax=Bdellovibrio sp. NC01 TaxID=2220073 RepID=UPI001FEE4ACB|nr:transglycosylase SLT domain-containing protein [Bdellovibrio sp. NC01]
MKPSTSSYIAKLTLMNICTAFLLGMGYGLPHSTMDLSSETDMQSPEIVAPVIEHALDQVDKAKNLSNLFGWFDNSASKNCEDCVKQISSMRYAQCSATDKNGYMEKSLSDASLSNSMIGRLIRRPVRPDSIIKPICMQMSMELGRSALPRSSFKGCSKEGYGAATGAACVSENYFKLMNNSFDLVSTCMKDFIGAGESEDMKKLDVRAVYALVNVESGFHMNAVSGTGAGGIGQFTSAAIKDVNVNELPAVRNSLESNANPVCGRMSMEFLDSMQPIKDAASKSCERISLKNGNPVKNMIYTFAYLRGVKKDMDRSIFKNKEYSKKFKLSEYDLAKVKRAMMVWSHNTGSNGTLTPTKALLRTLYRNKPVTNADAFIAQLQQYMQKYPAGANATTARRRETSSYFPKITNLLNQIENNAGGGSCVN